MKEDHTALVKTWECEAGFMFVETQPIHKQVNWFWLEPAVNRTWKLVSSKTHWNKEGQLAIRKFNGYIQELVLVYQSGIPSFRLQIGWIYTFSESLFVYFTTVFLLFTHLFYQRIEILLLFTKLGMNGYKWLFFIKTNF